MRYILPLAALVLSSCATGTLPQTANETKTDQQVYVGLNFNFPGLQASRGPFIVMKDGAAPNNAANGDNLTVHQTNSGDADSQQTGTVTPSTETDATGEITAPLK
jgi:hypothetical protein